MLERIARIERQLRAGLAAQNVRVIGAMGAFDLAAANAGYLSDAGPRLARRFLERGLLLRPLGNVVYFLPPYVITEAETEWALAVIRSTVCDPL